MMFGLKTYLLKLGSIILLFLTLLVSQVCLGQTGVEDALKKAYESKSIEYLERFIESYPNETLYIEEARRIIQQMAFEIVTTKNTLEAYEEYIGKYPNSVYVVKAKQWIEVNSKRIMEKREEEDYNSAKQTHTIESYNEFISKYPNSKYYNYAREIMQSLEYKENISTFSVEELIRFLRLYPQNPKSQYIFDTLQKQTLRYLSYEGLVFISYNNLFNIDLEEFQKEFALSYTQSGEVSNFEILFEDFPNLKNDSKLSRNYEDAKRIRELLKLNNIDNRTYNTNLSLFTSLKNDKSLELIKKYINPFIEKKQITNLNKALEPFEDDFRVSQFQELVFKDPPPKPNNNSISFNQDSTIKVISQSAPNGYGKRDIYISLKRDNSFQTPFILPKPINSIYDETSPIINNKGDILYFYSDNGMNIAELDLYISFRANKDSWASWSTPLKVNTIDFERARKNYSMGNVVDADFKPMDALVYIEDAESGKRLYITKTNPQTGFFAYPKQEKPVNIISINKGYITKYYSQEEDLLIKQDNIDALYSKGMILTIESIFSDKSPDKLSISAEKYLKYIVKTLEGSEYIITLSVHTKEGYKTLTAEDLSWRQATIIKDKLIELGLSYQNVIAAGYGNSNPLFGWEDRSRIEIGFMIL